MEKIPFTGFSDQFVRYFEQLEQNNNKQWFEEHRNELEEYVQKPAVAFVAEMGTRLKTIFPDLMADTRLNGSGSIFRIYRDLRFSRNKAPYKTHLGILFWEGRKKKIESSGFYFHYENRKLTISSGGYIFPKEVLHKYRVALTNPVQKNKLETVIEKILRNPAFTLGGKHYKRVPRGYEAFGDNPLIFHNGVYISCEIPLPEEFYSEKLLDYSFEIYKDLAPLHNWCRNLYV